MARALGHEGNINAAIEHLQKAREEGLSSFSEVDDDSKLAELRKDKRYAELTR